MTETPPLRVLHLAKGRSPEGELGGASGAVGGLAQACALAGLRVALLTADGSLPSLPATARERETAAGCDPPRPGRRARGVATFHVAAGDAMDAGWRFAVAWRPDILHVHHAIFGPFAAAVEQATGAPIVYTVHLPHRISHDLFGGEPAPALTLQEAALPLARRLIALTRDARDRLAGYYPELAERIRVVGNAIDDSEDARQAIRERRPRDPPTILYCGRFAALKGIDVLLAAVPGILARAPAARFVVIGGAADDPEVDRGLAASWRASTPPRYHRSVHFTGWLDRAQLAAWYRAADVLVVPSHYDTFPMVVLEGMLYGLPIAASAVGGPGEILEHGKTATLFPPGDVEALSGALLELIEDAERRHRLGMAAAAEVRRKWLWPRVMPKMNLIYRELVA